MSKICIPKEDVAKLKAVIGDDGKFSVDQLKEMSSLERTKLFSKYTDIDNAKKLNIGFEQRVNSKTKNILEKYIERELKNTPRKIKSDLTERLMKMNNLLDPAEEEPFLDELVAHKIGAYIEPQTAETLMKFAKNAQDLKEEIKDTETVIKFGTTGKVKPMKGKNIHELQKLAEQRLAYGRADYDVKHYMEEVVKQKADAVPAPEGVIPKGVFYGKKGVSGASSISKAVKATFDNSLFGRQGWKTLLMNPKVWGQNFTKSWVDIGRTFGDLKANRRLIDTAGKPTDYFYENVMREAHADIVSRPNSLSGKYRAARNEYGLGVSAEELFPVLADYRAGSKSEKIFGNALVNPIIRTHKGFENAFSAGALRMRADLADAMIAKVENLSRDEAGKITINVMDKDIANALGNFVSSVTGRGELGKYGAIGSDLNTAMFSPRFFKSQIDTILHPYQLAAHTGDFANIPKEVRRAIGKKYVQYLGGNAALLATLQLMGITDLDPRSDAFGYAVVNGRKYDMTGGQRGLFVLTAKMATTKRKNFTTGATYDVGERYGYDKGEEVMNFFEGKMAPVAGTTWRLITSGTNFDGYEIRPNSLKNTGNLINELLVPITLGTWKSSFDNGEPAFIQGAISEFLGVNNRTQVSRPNSGKWGELLNSNKAQYEKAVDEYNADLWKFVRKNSNSVRVKSMSEEDMADFYDKNLKSIKSDTLKGYEKYITP